jgi:hypothetical protein
MIIKIDPSLAKPAPVPASISRRQCAREILERGMIAANEALAMTQSGAPPAMVQAVFDGMGEPGRTLAMIDFAADTYSRSNPLLIGIMQSTGASDADIDDFFRGAGNR